MLLAGQLLFFFFLFKQTCQKGEMERGSLIRKPLGSLSGTSMGLVGETQGWVGLSNRPLSLLQLKPSFTAHFQQSFLLHLKDSGSSSAEETIKNNFVHSVIRMKISQGF